MVTLVNSIDVARLRFVSLVFLSLGCSAFAHAHVTLEPKEAARGSYAKLVFRVPHGCDGKATTALTVLIADGVAPVKPQVHPGWEISIKKSKLKTAIRLHGKEITESVSEVTWSGGSLPDEFMDEFAMSVKLPEGGSGTLAFPVIQKCVETLVRWDGIAHAGQDSHSLPFPAPLLKLK